MGDKGITPSAVCCSSNPCKQSGSINPPSKEVSLQGDLFTDELVDNRAAKQKSLAREFFL
jgi:hypothetical protein